MTMRRQLTPEKEPIKVPVVYQPWNLLSEFKKLKNPEKIQISKTNLARLIDKTHLNLNQLKSPQSVFGVRVPLLNPQTNKLEIHTFVSSLSSLSLNNVNYHEEEPIYSRQPIHKKLA